MADVTELYRLAVNAQRSFDSTSNSKLKLRMQHYVEADCGCIAALTGESVDIVRAKVSEMARRFPFTVEAQFGRWLVIASALDQYDAETIVAACNATLSKAEFPLYGTVYAPDSDRGTGIILAIIPGVEGGFRYRVRWPNGNGPGVPGFEDVVPEDRLRAGAPQRED